MTSIKHRQRGLGIAAVVALAMIVGGCLEGYKRIGVQYDKSKDQFTFLVMFSHISSDKLAADGGNLDEDSDRLKALWSNRDHLILLPSILHPLGGDDAPLAPFADDMFGWLRISGTSYAQVGLGEGSTTQPSATSLPLDTIQIKPGELFNDGGSNLCYYHQVIVPGAVVDRALAIGSKLEAAEIAAALDDELGSRGAGVATSTWDQAAGHLIALIDALPADPSAGPDANAAAARAAAPTPDIHVFSLDSLHAMKQAMTTGGKLDLTRSGSTLTVKMPMSAEDAAGIVANWPAVRDAGLAKLGTMSQKLLARAAGDAAAADPRPAAAALGKSINVGKDDAGLVVTFDAVALGQFLSDWHSLDFAALSNDDQAKQTGLSKEMGGVAATKMTVDDKLTVAKVMAEFADGTLASVPATQPVAPGTGLEKKDQ